MKRKCDAEILFTLIYLELWSFTDRLEKAKDWDVIDYAAYMEHLQCYHYWLNTSFSIWNDFTMF